MHEQPTQPWQPEHGDPGMPHNSSATGKLVDNQPPRKKTSRRQLFAGLAGVGAVAAVGGVALDVWAQHNGSGLPAAVASNKQNGHLLRRAGFGMNASDLATYASLSFHDAVDRLINYQNVADDALEQRLNALNLDLSKIQEQQRWWLLRMSWTQRPLLEKMTLFWHGYLTSSYRKVGGPKNIARTLVQNKFLRDHAFDSFDNILLGITSDPAMLIYLDLNSSTKKAPNENYARELMELFTLGLVGPDGEPNYTQQDVYEGAAALTGWHVKNMSTVATYYPRLHSDASLTYLGHQGTLDYKDVIHILTNHPATPWNLARRMFSFFVYANPSNADLQPLVDAYTSSNHSIKAVMQALLLSPQFSSDKAYRGKVKSPTEFVASAYRSLEPSDNGVHLAAQTIAIGQELFDPPNVAGWPGDKTSQLWLNSGTWMSRLNYINSMLVTRQKNTSTPVVDLQGVVDQHNIDSPEHFVQHFSTMLVDGNIDQTRTGQLVDYFTTADTATHVGQVTLKGGKSYPLSKVRGTVYLLMASPEYQVN